MGQHHYPRRADRRALRHVRRRPRLDLRGDAARQHRPRRSRRGRRRTWRKARLNAGGIEVASFPLTEGVWIGVLPLLQFVVAIAVIGALQLLFYRTALGRAFRATSDDQSVAQLMGLDNRHIFALAMALSLAVIAVAGVFIAVRTNFDPAIGPARLIFGFEAVIIGGLGSMWGTLVGGIILGVSQAIGAQINPGWQLLAGHLSFLLILAVRPEGLFPKVKG